MQTKPTPGSATRRRWRKSRHLGYAGEDDSRGQDAPHRLVEFASCALLTQALLEKYSEASRAGASAVEYTPIAPSCCDFSLAVAWLPSRAAYSARLSLSGRPTLGSHDPL